MAAASSGKGLRSRRLNELFDKNDYSEIHAEVMAALRTEEEVDLAAESAGKFLNSLAYHAYKVELPDAGTASRMVECTVASFRAWGRANSTPQLREKAIHEVGFVLFRRLLPDLWLEGAAEVAQAVRTFLLTCGEKERAELYSR